MKNKIAGLAVLLVGGFFAYQYFKNKKQTTSAVQAPKIEFIPTETKTEETVRIADSENLRNKMKALQQGQIYIDPYEIQPTVIDMLQDVVPLKQSNPDAINPQGQYVGGYEYDIVPSMDMTNINNLANNPNLKTLNILDLWDELGNN